MAETPERIPVGWIERVMMVEQIGVLSRCVDLRTQDYRHICSAVAVNLQREQDSTAESKC